MLHCNKIRFKWENIAHEYFANVLEMVLKRAISLKKLTDAKSTNQPELLLTALHLLKCRIVEDIAISLS